MSFGLPGRWTSPAEIIVVTPPWSDDSMKSKVRCRGVKSPKTGWACESMSPGITVVPQASMTTSASSSSPRPMASIRPSRMTMESASRSGRSMSPETTWPMPVISVRTGLASAHAVFADGVRCQEPADPRVRPTAVGDGQGEEQLVGARRVGDP